MAAARLNSKRAETPIFCEFQSIFHYFLEFTVGEFQFFLRNIDTMFTELAHFFYLADVKRSKVWNHHVIFGFFQVIFGVR